MKRALGLILITVACIIGFLSIRGTLPFIPIFGSSMEPTLQSGGLLMIEKIEPQDIKVDDIIVYNVPPLVRDYYNYPPTVAHRVIEIKTTPRLSFRTKGDNTGEDPFTILPADIKGTVGKQIPYLGLPLLFFQSQQGLIFVVVALVLLAIFLYGGELSRSGSRVHRSIFNPVINEEKRSNRILTRKLESTEQRMNTTEQALEKFSGAISDYARHLASHTSAIQGLAEASHELKSGAAEQNRVLAHLLQNIEQAGTQRETPVPEAETPSPEVKPPAPEVAPPTSEATVPLPEIEKTAEEQREDDSQIPPGCALNRQARALEALAAQKEISNALNKLHKNLKKSQD